MPAEEKSEPTIWAVVSPKNGQGFGVLKLISEVNRIVTYEDLDGEIKVRPAESVLHQYDIVAHHANEVAAKEAIDRAQTLEKQLRPMWQASIEHEIRLRNHMLNAVWEAAKPLKATA